MIIYIYTHQQIKRVMFHLCPLSFFWTHPPSIHLMEVKIASKMWRNHLHRVLPTCHVYGITEHHSPVGPVSKSWTRVVKAVISWRNMRYDDSKRHHGFIGDVWLKRFKNMTKHGKAFEPDTTCASSNKMYHDGADMTTPLAISVNLRLSSKLTNTSATLTLTNVSEVQNSWKISEQSASHANLSMVSLPIAIKQSSVSNSACILVQVTSLVHILT